MLSLIIIFALFALVLKLVDLPTLNKIKAAPDADSAIRYRKQLLRNRKIAFVAFVILIICYLLYDIKVALDNITYDNAALLEITISDIAEIVLLCIYLRASNKYYEIQGHISAITVQEFLEANKRFILFLRGFENDIYKEKNADKFAFSEHILSKVAEKGLGIPLCAVGMTKEGDSPMGGTRVYVNDKNWEDEVYGLMCKAEKIVILVNDRSSCIWEIRMTKDIYHKCVFVVDDLEKYSNVTSKLAGVIDLPELPESDIPGLPLEYDPRSFYFQSDNNMKDFSGDLADYCSILGLPADAVSQKDIAGDKKQPFYTRPFFLFIMFIGILKLLSALFSGNL